MFPHFDRRLQRDLQHIVNERLEGSETASGRHMKVRYCSLPIDRACVEQQLMRLLSHFHSHPA